MSLARDYVLCEYTPGTIEREIADIYTQGTNYNERMSVREEMRTKKTEKRKRQQQHQQQKLHLTNKTTKKWHLYLCAHITLLRESRQRQRARTESTA